MVDVLARVQLVGPDRRLLGDPEVLGEDRIEAQRAAATHSRAETVQNHPGLPVASTKGAHVFDLVDGAFPPRLPTPTPLNRLRDDGPMSGKAADPVTGSPSKVDVPDPALGRAAEDLVDHHVAMADGEDRAIREQLDRQPRPVAKLARDQRRRLTRRRHADSTARPGRARRATSRASAARTRARCGRPPSRSPGRARVARDDRLREAAPSRRDPASPGGQAGPMSRGCSNVSHRSGGGEARRPPPERPVTDSGHGSIEQDVPERLRLLEGAVPDRDRDAAVWFARRPGFDERASAVARRSRPAIRPRQDAPASRAPRSAACGGCRSSASRTRRGTAPAPRPSSTKWSDATQYDSASIRPAAERIPRATSGAAQTPSFRSAPWRELTPHSVSQSGRSGRPNRAVTGLQVERRHAVGVRRDEVERDVVRPAVLEQVVDPADRRRRRTSHSERRIDVLHGACGDFVQPEVLRFLAGPEETEVRLVPDFERPA